MAVFWRGAYIRSLNDERAAVRISGGSKRRGGSTIDRRGMWCSGRGVITAMSVLCEHMYSSRIV